MRQARNFLQTACFKLSVPIKSFFNFIVISYEPEFDSYER